MSQSAAATLATDDDKNAIYKRITLRLIPFIFICYLFNYLDRVNVGFAKLQMLDALKFSETVYGLGAGIFFIGYVLCGVPSNLALTKFGPRLDCADDDRVGHALHVLAVRDHANTLLWPAPVDRCR